MTYPPRSAAPQYAPGKSRASTIIIAVGVVVSVLAIVGSVLVLVSPDELGPTDVAEQFLEDTKNADLVSRVELMCQRDRDRIREEWGGDHPPQGEVDDLKAVTNVDYRIDEDSVRVDGEHATVRAYVTARLDGDPLEVDVTIPLIYESGRWSVCGEVTFSIR